MNFFFTLTLAASFFFVWSANPVHGVLSLVVVGLGVAGVLLGWTLEFPALAVVLVYVGAVTVLFIFVVMMVNLRATPSSYITAEGYFGWAVLGGAILTGAPVLFTLGGVGLTPTGSLNLSHLGLIMFGTERLTSVLVVGFVLFTSMVSSITITLVSSDNYRTQDLYSQIRRSNGVFRLGVSLVILQHFNYDHYLYCLGGTHTLALTTVFVAALIPALLMLRLILREGYLSSRLELPDWLISLGVVFIIGLVARHFLDWRMFVLYEEGYAAALSQLPLEEAVTELYPGGNDSLVREWHSLLTDPQLRFNIWVQAQPLLEECSKGDFTDIEIREKLREFIFPRLEVELKFLVLKEML